ncbi:MAG: hypothetical protein FIO03_00425, partial [Nitrosopumilales archaeon]|nr:hypothetical protein [Nitrosopumilales archaeon]
MGLETHELKIPKKISTIGIVTALSLSLLLTHIAFDNFPKSFAITTTNTNQTSAPPPPPQLGAYPELSATQISASTNKTCTLTSSLAKLMGTPQQTEGPY